MDFRVDGIFTDATDDMPNAFSHIMAVPSRIAISPVASHSRICLYSVGADGSGFSIAA